MKNNIVRPLIKTIVFLILLLSIIFILTGCVEERPTVEDYYVRVSIRSNVYVIDEVIEEQDVFAFEDIMETDELGGHTLYILTDEGTLDLASFGKDFSFYKVIVSGQSQPIILVIIKRVDGILEIDLIDELE